MEVTKLPAGEIAPADSDCIKVERTAEGKFTMVASALVECDDGTEGDSEAVIGSDTYDTYEAAEAAGLAWVEELCVEHVYIETSA